MKGLRGIYMVIAGGACIAAGAVFFVARMPLEHYTISYDLPLTSKADDAVRKYLSTMVIGNALSTFDKQAFKIQFPYIDDVYVRRSTLKKLHISVTVLRPLFLVNNDCLLLENGAITERSWIDQTYTHALRVVFVKHQNQYKKQDALCRWLEQVPDTIFSRYRITWINPTEIALHDKDEPRFMVISQSSCPLTESVYQQVDEIRNQIRVTPAFKRNTMTWFADIRFAHQVVLFSRKLRGDYEGSSFF